MVAGRRNRDSGLVYDAGSTGVYWSGTAGVVGGTFAGRSGYLFLDSSTTTNNSYSTRAKGFSVRCIQD